MSITEIAKGLAVLTAFGIFIVVMIKVLGSEKKTKIAKVSGTLIAISIAMLLMVAVCKIAGSMSITEIAKGLAVLTAFGIFIVVMIKVLNGIKISLKAMAGLLLLSGIVVVLSGILLLLSSVDTDSAIEAITGIAVLFITLVGAMKILQHTGSISIKTLASFFVFSIIVGVLAVLMSVLSKMNISVGTKNVEALSKLVIALSAAMLLLSIAGNMGSAAFIGIGAFVTLIAILAVLSVALAKIEEATKGDFSKNLDKGIEIAEKIGQFLGALVGGFAGGVVGSFTNTVGDGLSNIMESFSTFVGTLSGIQLDDSTVASVEAIGKVLAALAGAELAGDVGKISKLFTGSTGIESLGQDMTKFAMTMVTLETALKLLPTDFSELDKIAELGSKFTELANSVPRSDVVAAFTDLHDLGEFGADIKTYANNLVNANSAFSAEGFTGFNEEAFTTAGNIGEALKPLAESVPDSSLKAALLNMHDLGYFGSQINTYIYNLRSASGHISEVMSNGGFNEEAFTTAGKIGEALKPLAESVPDSSLKACFTNMRDLGAFGWQVQSYISALASANTAVTTETFSGFNLGTYAKAALIGKMLIPVAESVPDQTLMDRFDIGESAFETFAAGIGPYGEGIKAFAEALTGTSFEGVDYQSAVDAGTGLASVLAALNPDGVSTYFDGVSLDSFGQDAAKYGLGIRMFAAMVNGIPADAGEGAIAIGTALNELQLALPQKEGWFDNVVDLGDFGEQITTLGGAITSLSDVSSSADTESMNQIMSIIETLETTATEVAGDGLDAKIANLTTFMMQTGQAVNGFWQEVIGISFDECLIAASASFELAQTLAKLNNLGENPTANFDIVPIATKLVLFSKLMTAEVNASIQAAIESVNSIVELFNTMSEVNSDGADTLSAALESLASMSMDGVSETFSGAAEDMPDLGAQIIEALAEGMEDAMGSVTNIARDIASEAANKLGSKTGPARSAGSSLASAFGSGISGNSGAGQNAAQQLASRTNSVFPTYQNAFMNSGINLANHFIAGIQSKIQAAQQAAQQLAAAGTPKGIKLDSGISSQLDNVISFTEETSEYIEKILTKTIKSIVSDIMNAIEMGIDTAPTIRPVLDLTDVKAGIASINNMLGFDPNSSVAANIGAITTGMSTKNQNGNSDVIAAINRLSEKISGTSGDTYQIGDIVYDDDSAVGEAVKGLISAIKLEGRR